MPLSVGTFDHASALRRGRLIGLFDLPGYRVIDAVDRPGQRRQVIISAMATEAPCP